MELEFLAESFEAKFSDWMNLVAGAIHLGSEAIYPSPHARNIGAIFDSTLTMSAHVNAIVKLGFYPSKEHRQNRNFLSRDTTKILIYAFVCSKLDNYKSLLFGYPKQLIDKLQHLMNASARVIARVDIHEGGHGWRSW